MLSKKKRRAQTKCTADTGRLLHIYKSSFLTILQSVPLWVFGNEAESDKAKTLHENTAFFPCSLNARNQLCMTNWEHFAVPFAKLAKLVSSCLFLPAFLSWTTKSAICCRMPGEHKKQKKWHLLRQSLFVFRLFLHRMSPFMSSLRRNIKEAHSLLILTMTIQSLWRTNFTACACTFCSEKSGYCHYFLNIAGLSAYVKFCTLQPLHFVKFNKYKELANITRASKQITFVIFDSSDPYGEATLQRWVTLPCYVSPLNHSSGPNEYSLYEHGLHQVKTQFAWTQQLIQSLESHSALWSFLDSVLQINIRKEKSEMYQSAARLKPLTVKWY